jgi:Xaa-Pro aminopeptidase
VTSSAIAHEVNSAPISFDPSRLDALLEEAGIDVLIATSKHNIQYLFGGYRFFFFNYMEAIGVSRYLPALIYPKGKPGDAIYVGNSLEVHEKDLGRFWTPTVQHSTWGTLDVAQAIISHLRRLGAETKRIGIETTFLPADAYLALRTGLPNAQFIDALLPLERLRARKTEAELLNLREASERVIDAIVTVFEKATPGCTKNDLVNALRREEQARDLVFEYCLVTAGTGFNRAPSDQVVREGDIISLDSGGNYKGYIGDLCRMGILGQPDAELEDLLAEIDAIQQAARKPIKPGAHGRDIFTSAEELLSQSAHRSYTDFVAHGMGIISHEAPRLTRTGPVPYPDYDAERPLEQGMVVSIETTMHHPKRGFIKLEDTVAVTVAGYEAFGDEGRGWNRCTPQNRG